MGVQVLTDKSVFDEELAKPGTTIVYFTATWCGPCKLAGPQYEKAATSHEGKDHVRFLKVDVDDGQAIAQPLGVSAMPSFFFFQEGQLKKTLLGFKPPEFNAALSEFAA